MSDSWPAPDPTHGPALDIDEVAGLLGVTAGAVDVNLHRTRATPERVRVPFPEPDGVAARNGVTIRFWWLDRVEQYRDARRAAGGNRRVITGEQIAEIRRLAVDGMGVNAIARRTGITIASVSRIVNGKAHTPKGSL